MVHVFEPSHTVSNETPSPLRERASTFLVPRGASCSLGMPTIWRKCSPPAPVKSAIPLLRILARRSQKSLARILASLSKLNRRDTRRTTFLHPHLGSDERTPSGVGSQCQPQNRTQQIEPAALPQTGYREQRPGHTLPELLQVADFRLA